MCRRSGRPCILLLTGPLLALELLAAGPAALTGAQKDRTRGGVQHAYMLHADQPLCALNRSWLQVGIEKPFGNDLRAFHTDWQVNTIV